MFFNKNMRLTCYIDVQTSDTTCGENNTKNAAAGQGTMRRQQKRQRERIIP